MRRLDDLRVDSFQQPPSWQEEGSYIERRGTLDDIDYMSDEEEGSPHDVSGSDTTRGASHAGRSAPAAAITSCTAPASFGLRRCSVQAVCVCVGMLSSHHAGVCLYHQDSVHTRCDGSMLQRPCQCWSDRYSPHKETVWSCRQGPAESVARRLQMEEGAGAVLPSQGSWGGPGGSQAASRSGSRSPTRSSRREGHVSSAAASARALGRAGMPERLPSPEDVTSVRSATT